MNTDFSSFQNKPFIIMRNLYLLLIIMGISLGGDSCQSLKSRKDTRKEIRSLKKLIRSLPPDEDEYQPLSLSQTYNTDTTEITYDLYGEPCHHLRIIYSNFQDSTKTIYLLKEGIFSNVQKMMPEPENLIISYAVAYAVTDTTNINTKTGNFPHFFEYTIMTSFSEFEPMSNFERQLFQEAIIKCKCEKKIAVDYDKIIGWIY